MVLNAVKKVKSMRKKKEVKHSKRENKFAITYFLTCTYTDV